MTSAAPTPAVTADAQPGGGTPALRQRTARGLAFFVAQTGLIKVLGIATQVILSWLVAPADFGAVAMAYTFAVVVGIVQQIGLREVLVQRQRKLRLWAGTAWWCSAAIAALSTLLLLAAAPLAMLVYDSATVAWLVAILALAAGLTALHIVPEAMLQANLRYKYLAATGLATEGGAMVLSVVLAALGLGPLAFVLPRPIQALAKLLLLLHAARPPITRRLHLRRWRYLIGSTTLLLGSTLCLTLVTQGDIFMLSRHVGKETVGVYFFAMTLSLQAILLLGSNMSQVLFPSLARLNGNPARQGEAFADAARMLVLVIVPACVLQAVTAAPLVRLVFAEKWAPAIPLVFILSLGQVTSGLGWISGSLLRAQGRFLALFAYAAAYAAIFLVATGLAAASKNLTIFAVVVAGIYSIASPAAMLVALRGTHVKVGRLFGFFTVVVACSAVAGAAAEGAMRWSPRGVGDLGMLVIAGVVFLAVYAAALLLLARGPLAELIHHASMIAPPPIRHRLDRVHRTLVRPRGTPSG